MLQGMTVLLALACTNGCSPNPATTDVQALPYDTGRYDTAALDHDDIDLYSGDWEIPDPAKVREIMEELPPASDGIGYQLIDVPEG